MPKMPFLRWFTTFYGIQMRPHICAMFCNCDISVSQAQTPIFWHFSSKIHSFWEAHTEKMVKNEHLTAYYGIESYQMMTYSLNSSQICVPVLDQHCLTNCWPQPLFLSEFNPTKWSKMPFLRLFTAFTAFSREIPNRLFCFWHGCMRLHIYNSLAWVTMLRNFLKVTSVRKGRAVVTIKRRYKTKRLYH